MIFMGIYTLPANKKDQWMECLSGIKMDSIPSCIKKWQTFTCSDSDVYKGYNLVFAEKGQGDDALVVINRIMLPFCQIEGATWYLEPVLSMADALKVLK